MRIIPVAVQQPVFHVFPTGIWFPRKFLIPLLFWGPRTNLPFRKLFLSLPQRNHCQQAEILNVQIKHWLFSDQAKVMISAMIPPKKTDTFRLHPPWKPYTINVTILYWFVIAPASDHWCSLEYYPPSTVADQGKSRGRGNILTPVILVWISANEPMGQTFRTYFHHEWVSKWLQSGSVTAPRCCKKKYTG